ncbi:MAG: helix-turn-helix transcriptional regulator [Butyribacter sp.]|nr:helix-turn-helix transcriptional regulator [bacterium]MDY3854923.1 helix-turn-helix transcriptional regulator [Butyribacter sp.]
MQTFYAEVGERIAMLRVQKGYTRETLAKLVDISSKFLYEIENGKKGFSAMTLYHLAEILNVTCDFLVSGNETRMHVQKIGEAMQHFKGQDLAELQAVVEAIDHLANKENA